MKKERRCSSVIIFSTFLFSALFLGMIGYLGYFTATSEQEMINNSYNSRQEILLSKNYRGDIFASGGEVLAQTILDAEENETREYPYGNLFSHVVGYSTKGRTGVEALGNYYLINSNTPLAEKSANSLEGKKNPGDDIYTSLDVNLQQVAEDELGIYKGAIIVSEVETGRILALVSKPDFDPNEIVEIWDGLLENQESTVLLNRVTQGLYPPGSTFKIITALEYIRENKDTYDNYSYSCNGSYHLGDSKINCYHGANHGRIDFGTSFTKSCNTSFVNIGMSLDKDKFSNTLDDLLFNQNLPLDVIYSKSSVPALDTMSDTEMMQTSIGQGRTQITPMHLHMITSAIANEGELMRPYVMDRVVNNKGTIVKSFKPESEGNLMSAEEASILASMMTDVVESGTARKLKNSIYTAAGKTGSAEYNSNKLDSHAWFTGFAPAEDPKISVTIIIEGAGSGGDYAVPLAKRIMNAYFTGHAYGEF